VPSAAKNTALLPATPLGIDRAAALIRDGGLVAFPTETVYGLGADARNGPAVAGIFAAKDRPQFNPLIVHVADHAAAQSIVTFNPMAKMLADAFWPGPLTLVLPIKPGTGIAPLVSAGLATVAVRVPENETARALLRQVDGPVAAPSANRSGRISPTRAAHVSDDLGGTIDAVLDAGPCTVGLESTIIGFDPYPTLLRPGGLPAEVVQDCLGETLAAPAAPGDAPSAPGQLASHYAPTAVLRLDASSARQDETLLGFGDIAGDLNLSPAHDLTQAAANLFDFLHKLDQGGAKFIAVAPIPDHGLGRAINDRLRRAAAPRA